MPRPRRRREKSPPGEASGRSVTHFLRFGDSPVTRPALASTRGGWVVPGRVGRGPGPGGLARRSGPRAGGGRRRGAKWRGWPPRGGVSSRARRSRPASGSRRTSGRRHGDHHDAELVGLALVAAGVFLACVLWAGLNGGPVSEGVRAVLGWAAYVAPLVLVPLGVLMVARSALVDVRPFRLGLAVAVVGLMLTLGDRHGGFVGDATRGARRSRAGDDGGDDPRRAPRGRRAPLPDRRVPRRDPPALGPRSADGVATGTPASTGRRRRRAARPGAAFHATGRPSGRRAAGLPRPRLGRHLRAAAAPHRARHRPRRRCGHAGEARRRGGDPTVRRRRRSTPTTGYPTGRSCASRSRRRPRRRSERARGRGARPVPRALRRRRDGDRPDLGAARHAVRAAARARHEGREGRGA